MCYTGAALGFGLGSAIGGGGLGPYVAEQATALTGNIYAPAGVIVLCGLVGIEVVFTVRDVPADAAEPAVKPLSTGSSCHADARAPPVDNQQ